MLKYASSTEGYLNSEKFTRQIKLTVTIAKIRYPRSTHNIVFLFDQSSGHTVYADHALNVNRMNVNAGGSQTKCGMV